MSESRTSTLLEDAIDIPAWLEIDGRTPLAERIHRDREIGRELGAGNEAARVRRWWRRIGKRDAGHARADGADDAAALPGRRLHRARSWINLALVLLGLVGGTALALGAFHYDGTYPVNVVRLLALLVVPQAVLLALNLFLVPGRLPGLRLIQDALSAFNPGALAGDIYRQLTGQPESRLFTWAEAASSAKRRYGKWQMLFWSQIAAVAFNVGVIATGAMLIAFTDLAFGWSTTLDVGSETAARIFETIASPWAGLFPGAVPDLALVGRSQFFRLEGYEGLADSRLLTGWWAFSMLAVITYGLLPRFAFLILAGWRLHVATRILLVSDARVLALLERMNAPDLETRGVMPAEPAPQPAPAAGTVSRAELAGPASVIIWGQCVGNEQARDVVAARLGFAATTVLEAGSGALAQDRQSLGLLAATSDPVVVLTPSWEPPLLEFVDFLGELRGAIGPSRSIVVVPVPEDGQEIGASERENWSRAVGRARDPNACIDPGDT